MGPCVASLKMSSALAAAFGLGVTDRDLDLDRDRDRDRESDLIALASLKDYNFKYYDEYIHEKVFSFNE